MAVFMDTGDGDIYAGPTRESVIAAMYEDSDDQDFEKTAFEISGSTKMRASDENDDPTDDLVTLEEEYCEELGSYNIATLNG